MRWLLLAGLALSIQQGSAITISGDADAIRVLHLSAADVAAIRAQGVLSTRAAAVSTPDIFFRFPLPQSVPRNAKARAELKAQGVAERDITIGESVGAFVAAEGGFWFGKSFYDAEGESGRGDIGFLASDGRYTMLGLTTLPRWSVSAIRVEGDVIRAGMLHRGESGNTGHGLLVYDRTSKRETTVAIPDVIHTIVPIGAHVFVGTDRGPYMIEDGKAIRLVWR